MPIQAIFFDIGGVLIRTADRTPRTRLAARLGTTCNALMDLIWGGENGQQAQKGQISAEEQWICACRAVKWPPELWRDMEQEFFAGDRLDWTLVEYIRSLRALYFTGIISNALSNGRSAIEEKWKITDDFDALIFSAEVGMMKPDPHIYRAALYALNIPPPSAVFVDDVIENVAGARAVGMQAILFRSTEQVITELEQILAGKKLNQ